MKREPKVKAQGQTERLEVLPQAPATSCQECGAKKNALWKHQERVICYACLCKALFHDPRPVGYQSPAGNSDSAGHVSEKRGGA